MPPGHPEVDRGSLRFRWWRPVVVIGLVMILIGLVVWFLWMPRYRPALGPGERLGVDVSAHQGAVEWTVVASDDVTFAYLKATEGGDHVDERFADNWERAGAAGLDRGAYHFFTLCTPGAQQAENFLSTVPLESDSLPAAIDLELGGNCSRRPDSEWVNREIATFVERVEGESGKPVVLYVGDDFADLYPIGDQLSGPLWVRRILRRPATDDWWIWQFNYRAEVKGIEGGADLNLMGGIRH